MLKKVMIMLLMVSSLFLFGCGKEENNDSNKNNITYTKILLTQISLNVLEKIN